jgi:Na+-translocating ferredoxin:NAD+ oxidoreductase RnfG subunit
LELGKDIQGISGATISCRSTVEGVKKLTKRIYKLNQAGKL